MHPNKKITKKFTKKFNGKVINRQCFIERLGLNGQNMKWIYNHEFETLFFEENKIQT